MDISQTGLHVLLLFLVVANNSCHGFAGTVLPAISTTRGSKSGSKAHDNDNGAPFIVPRISLKEFLASPTYDKPILIHGIVDHDTIESTGMKLLELLGNEEIQMQRKIRCSKNRETKSKTTVQPTHTEIYDVPLSEMIGTYMMTDISYHEDSFYTFCEGLLPSSALSEESSSSSSNDTNKGNLEAISNQLAKIREAAFSGGENWFDYFPPSLRPSDAIIFAGCGSTSTLHRDPFEWTGTNLCLDGTKIWRFILPFEEGYGGINAVDAALKSYRLDSIAWEKEREEEDDDDDENPLILSAGWQSDMSLYETKSDDALSAMELLELEEDDENAYLQEIETMGIDPSCLIPDEEAQLALRNLRQQQESEGSGFVTAIQRAGDLLLIPAHCWHQTYAPVPSIAVASQRCGANVDGSNVIEHILSVLKINEEVIEKSPLPLPPDIVRQERYGEGTGKEVVDRLFKYLATITR